LDVSDVALDPFRWQGDQQASRPLGVDQDPQLFLAHAVLNLGLDRFAGSARSM